MSMDIRCKFFFIRGKNTSSRCMARLYIRGRLFNINIAFGGWFDLNQDLLGATVLEVKVGDQRVRAIFLLSAICLELNRHLIRVAKFRRDYFTHLLAAPAFFDLFQIHSCTERVFRAKGKVDAFPSSLVFLRLFTVWIWQDTLQVLCLVGFDWANVTLSAHGRDYLCNIGCCCALLASYLRLIDARLTPDFFVHDKFTACWSRLESGRSLWVRGSEVRLGRGSYLLAAHLRHDLLPLWAFASRRI